jgi:hypothetical protein
MWQRSGHGAHGCLRRIAPLRLADIHQDHEDAGTAAK